MIRVAAFLALVFYVLRSPAPRRPRQARTQQEHRHTGLAPYQSREDAARMAFGHWEDDRTWPSQELH